MRQPRAANIWPDQQTTDQVPLLPFRNIVIFPRNVVTLQVGRPRSIHAVEEAMLTGRMIAITAHRDQEIDDPRPSDLYETATMCSILTAERQAGGNLQVVLEGVSRIRLRDIQNKRPFFMATIEDLHEPEINPDEAGSMIRHLQDLTLRFSEINPDLSTETLDMVQRATNPSHLADLLATQIFDEVPKRQELLEILNPLERLERLGALFASELEIAELDRKIKDRVNKEMDDAQRQYYLTKQLEIIQNELGGDQGDEYQQLRNQIDESGMPDTVQEKLQRELTRLERMPNVSAESTVVRNYIDTMLAIPWTGHTEDRIDLVEAENILDIDHYGLDQVKERIVEFLAVRSLTQSQGLVTASQILCLAGPPGVGKTSLGRSIAEAMGRKFVRVSLGGVRDEAEIRGHRRTYIGAMPGRIITAMKTSEVTNPVILLDEIDKLASDYRGDPTAAMLEVLDPEQNAHFTDHYLDTPYDLSQVLFITTANYVNQIPRPLRDRMEMIEVSGYTEDEKIQIARRHLLRRQLTASGLPENAVEIPDDIWRQIIRDYTREAGVRGLDREVARLCRKIATLIVRGKTDPDGRLEITSDRLEEFLGPKKYGFEQDLGGSQIGLAIGLGTTEIGGEIIPVEVATMPGKGNLTITGQAGDVMQESARAALSYARSRAEELKIDRNFQEKVDLHIHLAEGATPKDGPSAGITMATALISALTQRPIRNDTAMTGEITLRGRVLAIGGLRDKALAAHRHGMKQLIAPLDNQRDLREIPENVRKEMRFIFVSTMDEVIQAAIMLDVEQADHLQTVQDRVNAPLPRITPDAIDARGR
ncbi:MAG TPA: endopeptidase La [Thermomicrobiales bacterium]|nr:endopeptidase La [Thermomicrobiales bacterium]